MNHFSRILSLFSIFLISSKLFAFTPTSQEKALYLSYAEDINQVASNCLQDIWNEHIEFYNRWGVSKFYGDRNQNLDTLTERRNALIRAGAPASLVSELEPTSCIGLTRRCLSEGFNSTRNIQLQNLWKRLDDHVRANGVSGVYLVNSLQQLGWKVLYWNPDSSQNTKWDAEDPKNLAGKPVKWNSGVKNSSGNYIYHPGWGMHQMRYQDVMGKNRTYYKIRVDDRETLVNFKTTVPQSFQLAPLFVGIAHSGYHVFPGINGTVIEAHSTRALDSIDNLEKNPFNPLAPNGGPRWSKTEKYRSGVIAVPPGY